jgi:hypothetical protein
MLLPDLLQLTIALNACSKHFIETRGKWYYWYSVYLSLELKRTFKRLNTFRILSSVFFIILTSAVTSTSTVINQLESNIS